MKESSTTEANEASEDAGACFTDAMKAILSVTPERAARIRAETSGRAGGRCSYGTAGSGWWS